MRSMDAPSGRLKTREEIALVFIRHEAGRQFHHQRTCAKPEAGQAGETDRHPSHKEPDPAQVPVGSLVEEIVETA